MPTLTVEQIEERARQAWEMAGECRLCPRTCGTNRLEHSDGVCRTGRDAIVSSAFAHHGEEDCLRGRYGSGTIFFSMCNLNCVFCQNYELSHLGEGRETDAPQLAKIMRLLQESGCHNINLVTPTHVVPQILDALAIAVAEGLRVPVVYNCSGYDSVETLRLLDGVVDIYMPDFKFWDPEVAERLTGARDYPETARNATIEMHRQTGDLTLDGKGIAKRGVLVRHLVLPNNWAGTKDVMRFLTEKVSSQTYVNLMAQYRPCGRAAEIEEIDRPVTLQEMRQARQDAWEAGITRFA